MKLTPAQQQYITLKQQHKDCILLFRIGDFYEMFYEDAHIAHRVLDITLTSRDKSAENPIPMAGIPHHALERYLPRLIKAGYKVALADQVGEVVPGKVVERQVTRIVTAATYIEQTQHTGFLCAISMTNGPDAYHCGLLDVATGKLRTSSFMYRDELIKYILKHSPSEIVLDIDLPERMALESYLHSLMAVSMSISDIPQQLEQFIKHHCNISSLDSYGKALQEGRERSFGLLGNYLLHTLKHEKLYITEISYGFPASVMHLDDTTMRNLELFSSSYEQKSQHSLFALLDCCHTAMGSRLLMQQLQYPSRNPDWLAEQYRLYHFLETQDSIVWNNFFKQIPDIDRSLSLLHYKGAQGVRIQQLRNCAALLLETGPVQNYLRSCCNENNIDISRQLFQHLVAVCIAHQPIADQGYVQQGYDQEVDRLRQLVYHTDDVLVSYQQELVKKTGIQAVLSNSLAK